MSAKPEPPPSVAPTASTHDEPYRRMVEGIRDYALFLLDTEGHVASWNQGAERIKGYKADEIIGRHFSAFYPQSAIDKGWPRHELETAARLGHFEDEGWRVRKDGGMFWANVVITAIRNEDGQLLGFSKITRDLTERRANEERLRVSEERFRMMVEGVRDYAIFLLDPAGYVVTWNEGAQRIKGYSPDEIIGKHMSQFYPAEARGGSRATRRPKSSASISQSSIRKAPWTVTGPPRSSSWPPASGASRTRAGACARTARASGPMSSSPRS